MKKTDMYNCLDKDEYKKYRKILLDKYKNKLLEELDTHLFIVGEKIDDLTYINSFVFVPIMVSIITIIINDIVNDVGIINLYGLIINKIWLRIILLLLTLLYCICLWGKDNVKERRQVHMLRLEKKVIEDCIELKSKKRKK